ncbi:MAG: thioredoxin [Alphaproteobacteria bacterium]|nr:thioredoxin [Alphaproteobacteria bacterium]MBF0250617.1 thioredoxin [Alphaproteobacteria bacterium]
MSDIILDPTQPSGNGAPKAALDLGPGRPDAPVRSAPADVIIDSSTQTFVRDVIEASVKTPVIVDFWAPWCGPCKTLGPLLEKLVKRAGGLVRMVKIDIDQNQGLAQQLRVQSVPTVFAFKDGRPVDAFMGAQPESQIQAFIDRLIGDATPPIEAALAQAADLLKQGRGREAEDIYTQILTHDPTHVPAFAGVIRAVAQQGDFQRARDMLARLDAKTRVRAEIEQAVSALELAEEAVLAGTSGTADLEDRLKTDPADLDARLALAKAMFAAGRAEAAIDHLLDIVRRNKDWNDQAGRKQLIKIFDTLGPTDPLTVDARRRLSTVLFS